MFHAVPEDSLEVVRSLVEDIGGSPDIRYVHGNAAIDEATSDLREEIVKYLRKECVKNPPVYS